MGWYYANGSEAVGPFSIEQLVEILPKVGGEAALVYGPDVSQWIEARHVKMIADALVGLGGPPEPPKHRKSDVVDYRIFGEEMQYVEIDLDPDEMVIAEAGAFMYMTPGIEMETVLGDPSVEHGGFLGKLMSAGKRVLTGESLFMTTFFNTGSGREQVAFAAPHPGKMVPIDLGDLGGELICQKDAFVCAARGVHINIAFQRRLGTGLFGGEGFIMQRLTGDGLAVLHAGGTLLRRALKAGETLRLDTGCLVALAPSVNYDIQFVKGIKNAMFGGEGLFYAALTGPGDVWCQSLPFSRLADRVLAYAPQHGGRDRGEGSVLGGFGRMLGGDR